MAGIYEALVRADRERNPTASSAPAGGWTDPSHDLAAVGAMLERLENRVETELADNYDERFEHFASLEVSIGALEDRLDDREREHKTSSADLATIVARLAAEVGELSRRIDHEIPLLRSELIRAIERQPGARPTARRNTKRRARRTGGLAGFWRRLVTGRAPVPERRLQPR